MVKAAPSVIAKGHENIPETGENINNLIIYYNRLLMFNLSLYGKEISCSFADSFLKNFHPSEV